MTDWEEYKAIQLVYGNRCGTKSRRPYIEHIDQGLVILRAVTKHEDAYKAFCMHPIYQDDGLFREFRSACRAGTINSKEISKEVIALAKRYAASADSFLPKDYLDRKRAPPQADTHVRDMLIADKVQNKYGFDMYVLPRYPELKYLDDYFVEWLRRLGVSQALELKLTALLHPQPKETNGAVPSR